MDQMAQRLLDLQLSGLLFWCCETGSDPHNLILAGWEDKLDYLRCGCHIVRPSQATPSAPDPSSPVAYLDPGMACRGIQEPCCSLEPGLTPLHEFTTQAPRFTRAGFRPPASCTGGCRPRRQPDQATHQAACTAGA